MDELGDWIYIIVMVVVGISSFVSSLNKKKRQQQSQMPLPEMSETLEPSYPTPYVPEQREKKQPPPVPGRSKHNPLNAQSTLPTYETDVQTEISFMQEEESTIAGELELSDPDAFRKAIIYSEILNRKY